jgi:rubrerythrin
LEEKPTGTTLVENACVTSARGTEPSKAAGLNPAVPVSYVGVFDFDYMEARDGEPATMVPIETAGTPCAGAGEQEACLTDFAELSAPDRTANPELHYRFIVTDEHGAQELSTVEEIKAFLGTVDTFNEAALILSLKGFWTECGRLSKKGDKYVTDFLRSMGCGPDDEHLELTLKPDGTIDEKFIGYVPSNCVEGRLTEGVCPPLDPHAARSVGEYLSGVSRLESAAVAAFMQLADELKVHGAPQHLIEGALSAAAEEIGHAKAIFELAMQAGSQPGPIDFTPRAGRSLVEIAIENATEGCVRELFGAACAHLQARQARDPKIRKTWQRIASEETTHAEWSLALDSWLSDHLSEEQRAQVNRARKNAVAELHASADKQPAAVLIEQAGVPSAAQVTQLLTELSPLLSETPRPIGPLAS